MEFSWPASRVLRVLLKFCTRVDEGRKKKKFTVIPNPLPILLCFVATSWQYTMHVHGLKQWRISMLLLGIKLTLCGYV